MIAVCHSTNSLKLHRKNKECAKHILAPVAVACDIFIIRRSAHPAGGFYYIGNEISYVIKKLPPSSVAVINILLFFLTSSHQQSQSVYPAVQNNYIPNLPSAADTWRYS